MARYTYAISDIHGQYDAFMKMLDVIDFQYNDELYIVGDMIDRGDKSIECIKWVMEQDNVLAMLGNHELLLLDHYLHNHTGIYNTIEEMRVRLSDSEIKDIVAWISDMPECKLITINNRNFYLNHTQAVNPEYFKAELVERMFPNYEIYKTYYFTKIKDIISIFGHIPTIQMCMWYKQKKSNHIWKNASNSIYDIDCGAGFPEKGGCLGCLRLNDMKEFYVSVDVNPMELIE